MLRITRKRAEKKSKKKNLLKRNKITIAIVLAVIVIMIVSTIMLTISKQPSEDKKNNDGSDEKNDNNGGEDFVFTALDGSEKHLSDYRGKVVILDIWATWCVPCQYQMLELREVNNHYNKNELEILSINVEPSDSLQVIQSFVDEFEKYEYELNWVFGNDDGSIWQKYQIESAIPTLYIFDQKGKIHYSSGQGQTYQLLVDKIDELIK